MSSLCLYFNCSLLLLPPPPPQCTVGSQVAMRVGGDFFFDPSPSDPSVDLLLVAGGVGINPLYSILLHTTDLLHLSRASGGRDYNIGSAHLYYSAKNTQELLFKVCSFQKLASFNFEYLCQMYNSFHVYISNIVAGVLQCVRRITFTQVLKPTLCSQSSIIEACREFPDKLSCDLHVTQQSADVDPHLQPFVSCK